MYVGLYVDSSEKSPMMLLRYTYDGYKWFDNTPRTFKELTNISSISVVKLTKDQKRVIIYY